MIKLKTAPRILHQALSDMEVKLLEYSVNQPAPIGEGLKTLVAGGGKRLRPLLCLLGIYYGKADANASEEAEATYNEVVELASLPELLHLASLIHDDIIDDASTRRGVEALHIRLGLQGAVYAGDLVILGTMNRMLCYFDKEDFMRFSRDLLGLVKAEILQMNGKNTFDLSVKRYLRVIEGKTARLLKLSFEMGAVYSGVPVNLRKKLLKAVHYMGIAFQLIDDCLDFAPESERIGKPQFQDLSRGYLTMPAINYFKRNPEAYKGFMARRLSVTQQVVPEDFAPDVERTLELAHRYTQKATKIIIALPAHSLNACFIELATLLSERQN